MDPSPHLINTLPLLCYAWFIVRSMMEYGTVGRGEEQTERIAQRSEREGIRRWMVVHERSLE